MKNKRRKRKSFIAPVEDEVVLDEGRIKHNADPKNPIVCEYKLSVLFPEHKIHFKVDKVSFIESGPSTIITRLEERDYEIPEYLAKWTGRSVVAMNKMNTAIIHRRKAEGNPIPTEYQFRRDIWMYLATDDEIEAHTKSAMSVFSNKMLEVSLRMFKNYRARANDAIASAQATDDVPPEFRPILKMIGGHNNAGETAGNVSGSKETC